MIDICPENEEVRACIGEQEYLPWKHYKRSIYTYSLEVEEGTLLYHLLTRKIVLTSGGLNMPKLVHSWFFVPDDVDEKSLIYAFWQKYYSRNPRRRSRLTQAVIFTTSDCNARCPYCYEAGTSKCTMTPEIANKAADYIIRECKGEKFSIKWFGGEPLVNMPAIDIISNRLKDVDIEFDSTMTSNGYLFDNASDSRIKDVWKLKDVQITIDGTKPEYERIKGFPAGAYDRVVNTIERLAKLNIGVSVRMHVTKDNLDDLLQLVKDLDARLSPTKECRQYVRLYAAPLFETFKPITDEERKQVYDNLIDIDNELLKTRIRGKHWIPKIRGCHCMADSYQSVCIAPTGKLTPCEHYHDSEIIGDVEMGGEIPEKWYERTPEIPECKTCFYYPQCCKLKMCNAEEPCNEQYRRYKRYQTEQVMLEEYRRYINNGRRPNVQVNSNSRKRGRV